MDYFDHVLRASLLLFGTCTLLSGCPDDPVVPGETDSAGTSTGSSTGTTCDPGAMQPCTCGDGSAGTQACEADGSGFGACECEDQSTTAADTTAGSSDTTDGEPTGTSTTTGPMLCQSNDDCADMALGECQLGVCGEDGMCVIEPAEFATPCGDATDDECTAPDTCDNAGNCLENHVDDGMSCTACAGEDCLCTAGACDLCNSFAPANNFTTTRSIEGWELTGSWGLHRRTPQSELAPASEFVSQVLGSDGNRVAPFPGSEIETSYARTAPVVLPEMIIFLSWNVDEGGGPSDNKTVRVSVDDGATWDTLVDCAADPSWPFCQPSMAQDPAIFSLVQIPVPMGLQGQTGIVEFGYDTVDDCCDFEKGWYIESLNIATECACAIDEDCAGLDTQCGTAVCSVSGECGLSPMPEGSDCGDPFENDCNGADECDGVGYCRDNMASTGLDTCFDCPGGQTCSYCDDGQCLDCTTFTNFNDFSDPSVTPWTITAIVGTADWGFFDEAPLNGNGTGPTPFPNAPVFGTDGNLDPPYPGAEIEHSQVVTSVGVVPAELSFASWNVDEGGGFYDTKIIDISVDGGMTWTNLVNCQMGSTEAFCDFRDDSRAIDDWDEITLDTSPWAGMMGQLRFTYNTEDGCCGFERGWYLDFTFAICDDVAFP